MNHLGIEFSGLAAQARRLDGLKAAIDRVLAHGQFVNGPEVEELESALAVRAGSRFAIACSSGTDALLMALMAHGVGPGDAVVVPTFTFPATGEVVALLGAAPVFADVDEETFNVDPVHATAALESAVSAGLRPRALIAVDLYGRPAPYAELSGLSSQHDLLLVADAAQSFGAHLDGAPVGSLAPLTATSFFPAKPLGAYGDGGCLFTDDPAAAENLRSIRSHGRGADKYDMVRAGLNARLDTIQAAILLEKLTVFDAEIEQRRGIAARYETLLGGAVDVPRRDERYASAWAQYTVRTPARKVVASELQARGIPTAVYYPRALHQQPAYARYRLPGQEFPVAERLCEEVLSLPMHPYLTIGEQERVASEIRSVLGG